MPSTQPPLSRILPPLICGTATFNDQYNDTDPYLLPTTSIVHGAFRHGIRAFDTSPYYGPAEELLGRALATPPVARAYPRSSYYLLTKVGRIASSCFDYSAAGVRASVARSLARLGTTYLDVVYCHDVEFVSATEVLEAVAELRRLRDEAGTIRYVGITGYPVPVLCALAERVLDETGEPLDIVMSYAQYTLQNTTLLSAGVARLRAARVDVVPNASVLGMGLLRQAGVPVGRMGDFHPAPDGLRAACRAAAAVCAAQGETLERVALRWGLESWLEHGAVVGSTGDPAGGGAGRRGEGVGDVDRRRSGVSVAGVSKLAELEETMEVWRSVLDGSAAGMRRDGTHASSLERKRVVEALVQDVWGVLGEWKDYAWDSPDEKFLKGKEGKESGAEHELL